MSLVYAHWMEMMYSHARGKMLYCCANVSPLGHSRPHCNLQTVTRCFNATFGFLSMESRQTVVLLFAYQGCRKAEREAKQRRCKRKAPGDFRNWATRDTCGVRGGTKHYTTSLHQRGIFAAWKLNCYFWSTAGDSNNALQCRFNGSNMNSCRGLITLTPLVVNGDCERAFISRH